MWSGLSRGARGGGATGGLRWRWAGRFLIGRGLLGLAAVWRLRRRGSTLMSSGLRAGCWGQGLGGPGDASVSGLALRCVACGGGGSAVPLSSLQGQQDGFFLLLCGVRAYCLHTAPVCVRLLPCLARGGRLVACSLSSLTRFSVGDRPTLRGGGR